MRYWAASARLGVDTAFDEGQLRVGRRLAIKVLNAARFALGRLEGENGGGATSEVSEPLDRSMLAGLADVVERATADFEEYDAARALERTEKFFWSFCDDYLELVKSRAYGNEGEEAAASARRALSVALSALLRLFAPHLPFATEEVWSWWQEGSIHGAPWPAADEARELAAGADPAIREVAAEVLAEVRGAKTRAQVSLRTAAESVVVRDTAERLAALRAAESDLVAAGKIEELRLEEAAEFSVETTLAAS